MPYKVPDPNKNEKKRKFRAKNTQCLGYAVRTKGKPNRCLCSECNRMVKAISGCNAAEEDPAGAPFSSLKNAAIQKLREATVTMKNLDDSGRKTLAGGIGGAITAITSCNDIFLNIFEVTDAHFR